MKTESRSQPSVNCSVNAAQLHILGLPFLAVGSALFAVSLHSVCYLDAVSL